MGQEIVYCYWCSNRIRGVDFDKGVAVQIGNHACCPDCLPKVMAALPAAQRETLLAELSKASKAPPPRNTPRGGTDISSTRTPRAVPVVSPPAPRKPPVVAIVVGVGVLVLVVILVLAIGGESVETAGKKRDPDPPDSLPAARTASDLARAAIDKSRDAARSGIDIDLQVRLWEEAAAKAERTPLLDEAIRERTAILARRSEIYTEELAKLSNSVDGVIRQGEYRKAIDALLSARKRHELPEWSQPIDRKVEEVKKAEAGEAEYRQSPDADGLLCFEAERYHVKVDRGDSPWTLVTAPPGFQGTGAMSPLPNKAGGFQSNFETNAPRMDYRIRFAKAGKHYLWIRGVGADGGSDSVHAGLDGKEVKSATAIIVTIGKTWAWCTRTMGGASATLEIPEPGVHTVNLWMREDGVAIDRVVITTNPKHVPKDAGPPESPR